MSRPEDPSTESHAARPPITDSPWFWVAAFCAAGTLTLLVIWPQYAGRQRRLEMQYLAREEILRRQAESDTAPRPAGQEGSAPPPAPGELIIPLWPLGLATGALFCVSAYLLWRGRRGPTRGPAP